MGRYDRQVKYLGKVKQRRLNKSRVLVVGCGALGSTVANILARAGVSLRLVDKDSVELSNLHRTFFTNEDVGKPKSKALAVSLRKATDVKVEAIQTEFNENNAYSLVEGCDMILDGTDSMEARFLMSDVSVKTKKPYIYAAVLKNQGHVITFKDACLRCLMGHPGMLESTSTAGVLSTAPATIGALEASEAIKYLTTGKREDKLICIDLEKNRFSVSSFKPKPGCLCQTFK